MLTKKYLKEQSVQRLNEIVIEQATAGNFRIIKYLLTSNDLENKPTISYNNILVAACKNIPNQHISNYKEIIKFLLSNEKLSEHAAIHADNDRAFRTLCIFGNMELVNYLIVDLNLKKTKEITDYIKNSELEVEVTKLFDNRDLNNKLNKELLLNTIDNKIKRNKV